MLARHSVSGDALNVGLLSRLGHSLLRCQSDLGNGNEHVLCHPEGCSNRWKGRTSREQPTTNITIRRRRPAAAGWSGVYAMKTPLPANDAERLNALRRYQILDTPPEPAFDRIAEMAASFFRVPMAGISLVDEGRAWFKSRIGINAEQTARDAGLCSSAMLSQGVFYLRDAAQDERALGHSFVADLGIPFYAP